MDTAELQRYFQISTATAEYLHNLGYIPNPRAWPVTIPEAEIIQVLQVALQVSPQQARLMVARGRGRVHSDVRPTEEELYGRQDTAANEASLSLGKSVE